MVGKPVVLRTGLQCQASSRDQTARSDAHAGLLHMPQAVRACGLRGQEEGWQERLLQPGMSDGRQDHERLSQLRQAADGSPGVLGGVSPRTREAAGSETAIASPTARLRELRDDVHAQAGELEGAVLRQAVCGHSARSADERPEQPSVSARARHERAGVDQGLVRSEASRLGSRRDEVRGLLSGQEPGRPPHQPHAERSSLGESRLSLPAVSPQASCSGEGDTFDDLCGH